MHWSSVRGGAQALVIAAFALFSSAANHADAADAAFQQWLAATWPEAQALGVCRATFDAATRGLEPDLSLPDLAIPGRPQAPQRGQAEFVQTPADYLKESNIARLAAQGAKLRAQYRRDAGRHREAIRRARPGGARDLGPRNRFRPLQAAPRCDPRARHPGLCGQAQGHVPPGIPAGAENAAGRHAARGHAQLVGRRHGAHPVPAVGVLQACASISTATAAATSGIRCPMRSPRPPSSSPTRAGSRAGAGPMRCTRRRISTARTASPTWCRPIGEWLKAGFVPAYGRKLRAGRARRARLGAAARGHLRPGVSGAEELLRHQGV